MTIHAGGDGWTGCGGGRQGGRAASRLLGMEGEPGKSISKTDLVRWIGLLGGPVVAVIVYFGLPAESLTGPGRGTAGVAALMAVWWLTEAIPLPATSLLPIALFPLLGAASAKAAAAPYASDLIYLFMGGFILGLGMERWGLHKRVALVIISFVGTGPRRLIAGFMLATALMSMWVSNTATAIMMLPIGMSVISLVRARVGEEDRDVGNFATCLLLGIAYGASIGGVGTLIGTPPNLVLANFVSDELGIELTMAKWLRVGLPLVAVFLPVAWLYLTAFAYPVRLKQIPGGRALIHEELAKLGPMKRGEWIVFLVFMLTAMAWIFRPKLVEFGEAHDLVVFSGLGDSVIAVLAALILFVTPVNVKTRTFAMDWETARKLPWGILLLFGGGLSLASAMQANGVSALIGEQFAVLSGVPTVVIILVVAGVVIFLTELTSNTAVTTTLMPILAGAAVGLGVEPMMLLVPAAIAASCAFMLPVATPPNAIVFSSGQVSVFQMAKAGLWLNLIGMVIVTGLMYLLGGVVVGLGTP